MKGSIWRPARIVTRLPRQRELAKHGQVELSEKAKHRLEVPGWYFKKSARFSLSGKPEVRLDCRYFGIHRPQFYRWENRFAPKRHSSLEPSPAAPKRKRQPEYTREPAGKVRAIRKEDPTYSGKNIRPILLRSITGVPSMSTSGRLIKREGLFFRPDTKLHRKRPDAAIKTRERKRKPAGLKAEGPNQVAGYDMKYVYLPGNNPYAFAAIDPFKKDAVLRIATTPSSLNSKAALEAVVAHYGTDIALVNDNGSGNKGKAGAFPAGQNITQLWTRPCAPKEKPRIKCFIGTFQRECQDYHYEPVNAAELQALADDWLGKYYFYRPHESPGGLTPAEFSATLNLSIPHTTRVLLVVRTDAPLIIFGSVLIIRTIYDGFCPPSCAYGLFVA